VRSRYTQSFKIQAVEKALSRTEGTNLKEIAQALGVGYSTLEKWIRQSREQEFESLPDHEITSQKRMHEEKRPQDWSHQEKLDMVITCSSLNEQEISKLCREKGLYPHHVNQWKVDFLNGNTPVSKTKSQGDMKTLRAENKALKKELNRKDRALAETAALLVLQKKVHEIWGSDEDNSL
jgi:transposase-like protein